MSTTPQPNANTEAGGVSSRHPLYNEFHSDWVQMRDCYRGQRVIKEKGTAYLPATEGHKEDGMKRTNQKGFKDYTAYKTRAYFPDVVNDAVEAMIGVMHNKPPKIELPEAMESMRESATLRGESLEVLLRRINEEQIVTGRLGLMADLPKEFTLGRVTPYLAFYAAERVINWDEGRRDGIVVDNTNLVVLDESEFERKDGFTWEWECKYRVLSLQDPQTPAPDSNDGDSENLPQGEGTYYAGVFRDPRADFSFAEMSTPQINGQTLDEIPFVFINSKDVVPEPDDPPLIGLSNLALQIYRGDADYRQALFMQGQDILVVVGGTEDEFRIGGFLQLPVGASAEYVGTNSEGIPEMRTALENLGAEATAKGGQLLDTTSRQKESGEALSIRVAARTATLNQIALAGAFGLEQILKKVAKWMNLNPDQVSVEPNLDFVDDTLGSKELVEYMTAKSLGAPFSLKSIHDQMRDKNLTEMEYEDELAEIEKEEPLTMGSENEEGPEDDEEEDVNPDETDDEDEDDDEDTGGADE